MTLGHLESLKIPTYLIHGLNIVFGLLLTIQYVFNTFLLNLYWNSTLTYTVSSVHKGGLCDKSKWTNIQDMENLSISFLESCSIDKDSVFWSISQCLQCYNNNSLPFHSSIHGFVKSSGPCVGSHNLRNFPSCNEEIWCLKARNLKLTDLCKGDKHIIMWRIYFFPLPSNWIT